MRPMVNPKVGDSVRLNTKNEYTIILIEGNTAVLKMSNGMLRFARVDDLNQIPLTYVEGKPVYPGDELRYKGQNYCMRVTGRNHRTSDHDGLEGVISRVLGGAYYKVGEAMWAPAGRWTWNIPEKVQRTAFINIYKPRGAGVPGVVSKMYWSKAEADNNAGTMRVDCIEINWEEQV